MFLELDQLIIIRITFGTHKSVSGHHVPKIECGYGRSIIGQVKLVSNSGMLYTDNRSWFDKCEPFHGGRDVF
jgi:hypothetical protein